MTKGIEHYPTALVPVLVSVATSCTEVMDVSFPEPIKYVKTNKHGDSSRHWGLALDTIVGLDVVLANGSFIHASATEYPDVYFAMRGAGDSFGIATTFYLQTEEAPAQLVNFLIDVSSVLNSVDTATTAFMTLQDWVLNSPLVDDNLSFGIYTQGMPFP